MRRFTVCLACLVMQAGVADCEESDLLAGAADPAIAVISGAEPTYLVFATGRGIPIFSSRDLVDWKLVGRVFDSPVPDWARTTIPGATAVWAPDISCHKGEWRLYYSISTFGSQRSAIGLAVNKTLDRTNPAYRWEDRGAVLQSRPEANDDNAIDPACFVDQQGRNYLFWGSFWTGIKVIALDNETGLPEAAAQPQPVAARAADVHPPAIEGAYVIWRDGFYYLFVSWDACCDGARSTYKVIVGRSKEVTGPYQDMQGRSMLEGGGTLVLASYDRWRGPGHNSVLQTPEREFLVHHTYDTQHIRAGRILQLRPMYWDSHGWPVVGEPYRGPVSEGSQASLDAKGIWRHRVNYGDAADLEFVPDGTIAGASGPGRWQQTGNRLELRWPNQQAPGGEWIDSVLLEPDGHSYIGRNQRGAVIQGLRAD